MKKTFCITPALSTLYFLAMNISFISDISRNWELWLKGSIIFVGLIFPLAILKKHHTHNELFKINIKLKNLFRYIYEISFWYLVSTYIAFLLLDFIENNYFSANKFTLIAIVLSCTALHLSEYILFSLMFGRTNNKINFKT